MVGLLTFDGRGVMTTSISCQLNSSTWIRLKAALFTKIIFFVQIGLFPLCIITTSGCSTSGGIAAARQNFYMGNLERADGCLSNLPPDETHNKVLMLMERGTIRQLRGNYQASANDWQKAAKLAEQLDYYSLSKGSASFVINDNVIAFRGAPYELILLHTFNAQNYLAMGMRDDATVEARNLVKKMQNLDGFPDDAFSRYVAGFCFELDGSPDSARIEYTHAASLIGQVATIAPEGCISPPTSVSQNGNSAQKQTELLCFIYSGRAPSGNMGIQQARIWEQDPHAEIFVGGRLIGRSYTLTNTGRLRADTERRLAAIRMVKEVTRIVVKQTVADAISRQNQVAGELVRLLLFALETPDIRSWETLPLNMQVARVPCPANLSEFKVVFKDNRGRTVKEKSVSSPITRYGNTFFSFCRDM